MQTNGKMYLVFGLPFSVHKKVDSVPEHEHAYWLLRFAVLKPSVL